MMTLSTKNASNLSRLGVTKVKSRTNGSSLHLDCGMLKNTLNEGMRKEL